MDSQEGKRKIILTKENKEIRAMNKSIGATKEKFKVTLQARATCEMCRIVRLTIFTQILKYYYLMI